IDDKVHIPDSSSLDLTDSYTLTAWVKRQGQGDGYPDCGETIISKHNTDWSRSYVLQLLNKKGYTHFIDEYNDYYDVQGSTVVNDNEWYQVAGAYDYSTGIISIYLNGELDNSANKGQHGIMQTSVPVLIGAFCFSMDGSITRWHFNGIIDEARIYNRALSESEIQTLYNQGGENQDQVDQSQTEICGGTEVVDEVQWAQSFRPTSSILTRVQLFLQHTSSGGTGNMIVSIRDNLYGNDITSISRPLSIVPGLSGWIDFDFPDITVTPENTYYIVFHHNDPYKSIIIFYCDNNPYLRGCQWVYDDSPEPVWTPLYDLDLAFKTYATGENQPDFEVTDIVFTPINPVEGQPTIITAKITNVGNAEGTATVVFNVGKYYLTRPEGGPIDTTIHNIVGIPSSITLDAGETGDVTFSVNPPNVLDYWVASPIYNNLNNEDIGAYIICAEDTNPNNNELWINDPVNDKSSFSTYDDGFSFENWGLTQEDEKTIWTNIDGYLRASLSDEALGLGGGICYPLTQIGGHCYGMSATSILYKKYSYLKPNSGISTWAHTKNQVAGDIKGHQVGAIVDIPSNMFKPDMNNELNKILSCTPNYPIMLNIIDGKHVVVVMNAYKINDNEYNLVIYDTNYPGIPQIGKINLASKTFQYLGSTYEIILVKDPYLLWWEKGKVVIYTIADTLKKKLWEPFWKYANDLVEDFPEKVHDTGETVWDWCNDGFDKAKEIGGTILDEGKNFVKRYISFDFHPKLWFRNGGNFTVNITITDQYGRIISSNGTSQIPDATVVTTNITSGFYVPANLTYYIEINTTGQGILNLSSAFPWYNKLNITGFTNVNISDNATIYLTLEPYMMNCSMNISYRGRNRDFEIIYNDINVTVDTSQTVSLFNNYPVNPVAGDYTYLDGSDSTFPHSFFDNFYNEENVSYQWNLGDGNTSESMNFTHRYAQDGNYSVSLTVTDNYTRASNTSTFNIIVLNKEPTANFSYIPLNPFSNTTINFTDLSNDTDLINWTWDFGDGNTCYEQNPTHLYATGGNYTITLTVTDDNGKNDSISKNISVKSKLYILDLLNKWNFVSLPFDQSVVKTNLLVMYNDSEYTWQE
ncbi:MAG: PKD domain-containing protein, partial [Candidatus Thermoplasmatota archaeon]|nr:PKD domain-containing protein [Candidatus Thermoplasmatota archaeon]